MSADACLSSNLQTVITAYGLRVMLHDTDKQGMFESGSAVPSARFAGVLHKMGPLFAAMANQMLIVGHTDSQAYADRSATAFSNWNLSSNRAMAARGLLIEGGMASDGILQVVGMADRAPIDTRNVRAGVNRRIELLILTAGQADSIAAMFGTPAQVTPLIENVDSALPDRDALQALRDHLLKARPAGPR
jgi:chemotaxis protein MotB